MNTQVERKLRAYIRLVTALGKTKFYTTTKTVGVKSIKRRDGKMQLKTFGFEENLLRGALIDFRKIILEGEDTNFYAICNLIAKGNYPRTFKIKVQNARREFSEVLNKEATLYDHKTHDKPKDVLDKWLNGKYFHQNKMKRVSVDRMGFVRHVHKIVFVATVLDLTKVAVSLSKILSEYLKKK